MLDDGVTSYALVVPERARAAAFEVPATVRQRLDIAVFLVDDLSQVHCFEEDEEE